MRQHNLSRLIVIVFFALALLACSLLREGTPPPSPRSTLPPTWTPTPSPTSDWTPTPSPTPKVTWSILPLVLAEDVLQVGESRGWNLEDVSADVVLLSLEARIDWPELAGSAPIMEILVNTTPVTSSLLINKPLDLSWADGRTHTYYRPQKPGAPLYWLLHYSPDYYSNELPGSIYQVLDSEPYLFVFDITGLLQPGRANDLTLINRGELVRDILQKPVPLAFRQVKLLQRSQDGAIREAP